ncbi:hypothetical protein BX600DRAFT_447584 [Xylariales sp. PMI_506]|nr:hypothetical protein BX600DRAFT_447584 [Xylariales sp. PMI_506]
MKLSSFFLSAVACVAAAAHPEAEVYILQGAKPAASDSSTTPSLSADVAHAILQQRLGGALSDSVKEEDYSTISRFGKATPEIFASSAKSEPKQLVIVFKNADENRISELKKAVGNLEPSFTTPRLDYLPSKPKKQCDFEDAMNVAKPKCWSTETQYLEYDLSKGKKMISTLAKHLDRLQALAGAKLDTTIVFLPTAGTPDELRRRAEFFSSEKVMDEPAAAAAGSKADVSASSPKEGTKEETSPNPPPLKKIPIPSCFGSQASCESGTRNCSGHGMCQNKFGPESKSTCFSCHCLSTRSESGSVTHWGGGDCGKQDISTPFWLFVGFTIFIVGTIGFSISMLFNVGEEPLPGVIGAGVSRNSK